MSVVQFATNESGKKLTLVTLHLQQCLYFDGVYSFLLFPLELLVFIIKGNMLYYTNLAGELVFVIVLAAVQALRYIIWLPQNIPRRLWQQRLVNAKTRSVHYHIAAGSCILCILPAAPNLHVTARGGYVCTRNNLRGNRGVHVHSSHHNIPDELSLILLTQLQQY
jgi:hypothetical protein